MTIDDQREIFAQNFKHMLYERKMSQLDLARLIKVPTSTINTWYNGQKVPRVDKLDKLCGIFACTRSDLLENPDARVKKAYFADKEEAKLAQKMLDSEELKKLVKMFSDVSPEYIEAILTIAELNMKKDASVKADSSLNRAYAKQQ